MHDLHSIRQELVIKCEWYTGVECALAMLRKDILLTRQCQGSTDVMALIYSVLLKLEFGLRLTYVTKFH